MMLSRMVIGSLLLLSLQGPQDARPMSVSDFPPWSDSQILSLQRRGLGRELALKLRRTAPDSPDTVEILLEHELTSEALTVAKGIVQTRADRIVRTLEIVGSRWSLGDPGAREIVAEARQRLPLLPREDAARVAHLLFGAESGSGRESNDDRIGRLNRFIQEYDGTQEAKNARVIVIRLANRDTSKQLQELDAFARRYPRTIEAAYALHSMAFDLSANQVTRGGDPDGSDPTERFLKVLEIANELENGSYPSCEWVEKAPSLVIEFSASEPKYSPGNLDRMIEALTRFATRHFTLDDAQPTENAIGYLITDRMAELFRQKGEPIAGMERTLAQLERDTPDAGAVRYLRALFYAKAMWTMPDDRAALRSKEIATLVALAHDGSGRYQRKALATLAALHFDEGGYATARDYFREYLEAYPRSDWAWVAALRIGQSQEALDDLPAAVESYRTAAARYGSNPLARVLGHTYAARASEARSAFDQALAEYRAALEGWDPNYGPRASLYSPNAPAAPGRWQYTDLAAIEMEDLSARISQLHRLSAVPGGLLLERGRWLLSRERRTEGEVVLGEVVKQYPRSAAVQEARELIHRSRLSTALDIADADQPGVGQTKMLEDLAAISREPYSFGVCAAKIAMATILWQRGSRTKAQPLMTAALQEWSAQQNAPSGSIPAPLEKDIAEIRDLVFRPKGDGVFTGTKWEGDAFSLAPFLVVDPDIRVTLADGTVQMVTPGRAPLGGGSSVLLLNADQQLVLDRIITKLGGTKTRPPDDVMEVPNQPAGPSRDVMAFWNRFFRMRPGHWGGWMFSTNPIITGVTLTDAARSTASAHVTIGYEGATVVLEKKNGTWRVLGIGGFWIT